MQVVFFPAELNARAPAVIGCLYVAPDKRVTLLDVADALLQGEAVTIRQASSSELKRAESFVALFEVGMMLGAKLSNLLDEDPSEQLAREATAPVSHQRH